MKKENIRVLILEDNPNDGELLQRALKKAGLDFFAKVVHTRFAYENALENFAPDIILSDFSLPSFDGISALKIKQEKAFDTPFIIVSGTIGEEKAVELIKLGVTDYVLKSKLVSLGHKITRALKDAADMQAKRAAEEKLRIQYEKLLEIAFLQSHQVRVPVAHILGLFNLFNFDDYAHPINAEILISLKDSAKSLDIIIAEIIQKTTEVKAILNSCAFATNDLKLR